MTSIEVKTIFKASQHLGNHQKCLKDINKIVEKTISKTTKQTLKRQKEFVENLLKGSLLLVLYNDPKSPYVKTAIKFVVSFIYGLMKEEENNDTGENRENRHPDVSQDDIGAEAFDEPNPKQMLADRIIMDLAQKWLYNKYTNIRVNGIILIRLLLKECCNNQLSISSNTYETIRDSLIERFADKDTHVRTETALAMEWFQDADVVASAYQFHMTKDPCSNVRRNCLLVTQNHNLLVSHGIRDIEAINRKTAYTKIGATKIRKFTIDQRIKIIKTGIRERNKAVKKTFVEKLLLQWYNTELKATGDVINFIKLFDVQSDVELHDQMLGIIFNYLLERTEYIQDFRYTAFHKLLFNFCKKYLSKQTKSLNIKWSVDHTFLWRRFAEFCRDENITVFVNKTHDDGEAQANEAEGSQGAGAESGEAQTENCQIQVPEIDSQMGPADQSQNEEPSSLPVPFLDYIIPDVPNFCQYVNELITHVIDSELTELELDDCEFIFNELMKIALIYDLTDDVERKNMFELCDSIINNGNLKDKFINYIPSLMKCLAQKYFGDSFEPLSQYTLNLIHEVLSLVDHQDRNTNEQEAQLKKKFVVTEEEINQIEMKWAKLTVEINELRDQLEEAKGRSEFLKAQGIKDKIDVLIREREELAQKRLAIKSVEAEQEPEEPVESDQLPKIIRHRDELHRCLLLLHGSLRYGKIKKGDISPLMKQSIEEICLKGGLMSENIEDRELGVRSLGIACMYDAGLSKDRFWLLTEILKRDEISVRNIALEAIFDILCSHGFGVFDDIDPQDKDKSDTSLNLDHHRSFAENDQSEDAEMKSDEDTEEENDEDENDEDKQEKETFNEIEESQAQSQEEIDANFNQFLTRFFIFLLESHEDIIKLTASKGIGKLMLFGRLQSQILFSKLVLMWYDNESNAELKEYLGLFLPFFAQHNIHGIKGQVSFEDCFIPLIEQVFYDKIEYVPMENMINFLSDLTSDEVHSRLVLSISNKILTQTFNNDISSHLVYALTQMRLDKMEKRRLKEFKILINQMKNDVQQVKEGAKKKKLFDSINKIGKKIDYYLDKLAKDNANSNHLDDSFKILNDIQPSSTQPNGTQLVDSHSGDTQTGDTESNSIR